MNSEYKKTTKCPFCGRIYSIEYTENKGTVKEIKPVDGDTCQHYKGLTRCTPALKFRQIQFVSLVEYKDDELDK